MATNSRPTPDDRRTASTRVAEVRSLETPLRSLARARRAAPLLYLELTGLESLNGARGRATRASYVRAATVALRGSIGSILRQNDPVVAGRGAGWFAALLVDRAVDAQRRAAVSDADIGMVAGRLRAVVQTALAGVDVARSSSPQIGIRAGWTVIEPRDHEQPLRELRHALRGAAVVARVEEQRATLLAAVTHELRTPLTSIIGYSERLSKGAWADTASRKRSLAIIHDEGRRLSRLVEGLIDMGAWNAGRLTLRKKRQSLRALADRALELVGDRAAVRGVRLKIRGEARADVDADRLLQVLVNVVDNAVRYAKSDGLVRVSITKRERFSVIAVQDDGPGFTVEAAKAVGAPFVSGRGGRVGLGLAISKMLVEAHGGTIVPRRARVTVSLPR